jgi:hypothetical protein
MNRKIGFVGILSGDHESFCWDVDRETFILIKDEEPTDYDKSCFNKGLYRIYPDDIFGYQDKNRKEFNIEMLDEGGQNESNNKG